MRKFSLSSNYTLVAIAIIASALSLWPWFLLDISGDDFQHYSMIQCIGEHLWQGHLYPRWCMDANVGYGSPAPMFYLTAPYYITALFYPLISVGFTLRDMLVIGIWIASIVGFITTTLWLSSITTKPRAIYCSFILLWLGYWAELSTFRIAYPELCAVALLPLLFLQVRNMVAFQRYHWGKLALTIMVCMLFHTVAVMIGMMACGLYLLAHIRTHPKAMAWLVSAFIAAFAATFFNWFQYAWFAPDLASIIVTKDAWETGWANNFVKLETISDHLMFAIYGFLVVFLAIIFATPFLRKPVLITDVFVRKELVLWGGICLFAFFMMFSPSRPLWDLIEAISYVRAPWRMQMLTMFGFVFLLAIFSRYGFGSSGKVRRGDALAFAILLMFLNLTTVSPATPDASERRMVMLKYLNMFSFASTKWSDEKYIQIEPFYKDYVVNKAANPLSSASGKAKLTPVDWSYGNIAFDTSSTQADTIRIDQFYFPTWRATIDGVDAELKPREDGKGLMMVDVPAGKHDVRVVLDWTNPLPSYYRLIVLMSALSFLLIIGSFFWHSRKMKKQSV